MDRRLRKTWGWIIWKERNSRYFAQEILFISVPIFEFTPLPFPFFFVGKTKFIGIHRSIHGVSRGTLHRELFVIN